MVRKLFLEIIKYEIFTPLIRLCDQIYLHMMIETYQHNSAIRNKEKKHQILLTGFIFRFIL